MDESSDAPFAFTAFHPGRSYFDDGGVLMLPAGGYAPGSGIWDGHCIVERSHPNYQLWLWIRAQPQWQSEDATVTDQELESLRREYLASLPDAPKA
jgi:hypothetical protein